LSLIVSELRGVEGVWGGVFLVGDIVVVVVVVVCCCVLWWWWW
jgi:hypothetical protein